LRITKKYQPNETIAQHPEIRQQIPYLFPMWSKSDTIWNIQLRFFSHLWDIGVKTASGMFIATYWCGGY